MPGFVPASISIQTSGSNCLPIALNSHLCELIFLLFFCFRQKIIWTGTKFDVSAPSTGVMSVGFVSTESWVVYYLRHGAKHLSKRSRSISLMFAYAHLEEMCNGLFAVDFLLHDIVLVDASVCMRTI